MNQQGYRSINQSTNQQEANTLTIQNLINQYKVVLHILLVQFPEVRLQYFHGFGQQFKHHGRVDVLLRHDGDPDIAPFDVEETGPGDVCHGGPHLLARVDHVDTEGIDSISPAKQS